MLSRKWILQTDTGLNVQLRSGRLTLGSGDAAFVRIHHESVDPIHAELECSEEGFRLRDCGSSTGTWLTTTMRVGGNFIPVQEGFRLGSVHCHLLDEEHTVAIPELTIPKPYEPQFLEDGRPSCSVHPGTPATLQCSKCQRYYCTEAARVVGLKGSQNRLAFCRECDGPCAVLEQTNRAESRGRTAWRLFCRIFGGPPRS